MRCDRRRRPRGGKQASGKGQPHGERKALKEEREGEGERERDQQVFKRLFSVSRSSGRSESGRSKKQENSTAINAAACAVQVRE